MDLYPPLHYILNAAITKYPSHSQNSLNTSKKMTSNVLISPLALYFESGNPVISTPLLYSYTDERRYI